jgi:hypothetical protein
MRKESYGVAAMCVGGQGAAGLLSGQAGLEL